MSARAQRQPMPKPARSPSGAGRVCLGRVVGAKGLKGELRVRAYTERPRDLAAYGPVEDETGGRSFALSVVSETEGGAVVRLKGVADRTAAEKLKGMALYVPRAALPPLPEGEYYQGDLIGLKAVDESGRGLGRVRAIRDHGAGAILEIEDGLWPAGAIVAVDLHAGKIVLTQPAELIAHNGKGKRS